MPLSQEQVFNLELDTQPSVILLNGRRFVAYERTRFFVDANVLAILSQHENCDLLIRIRENDGRHPVGFYEIPHENALDFILSKEQEYNWQRHENWHSQSVPRPMQEFFHEANLDRQTLPNNVTRLPTNRGVINRRNSNAEQAIYDGPLGEKIRECLQFIPSPDHLVKMHQWVDQQSRTSNDFIVRKFSPHPFNIRGQIVPLSNSVRVFPQDNEYTASLYGVCFDQILYNNFDFENESFLKSITTPGNQLTLTYTLGRGSDGDQNFVSPDQVREHNRNLGFNHRINTGPTNAYRPRTEQKLKLSHLFNAAPEGEVQPSVETLRKACLVSCSPLNIFPTPTRKATGNVRFAHQVFEGENRIALKQNDIGEEPLFIGYFFKIMELYLGQTHQNVWDRFAIYANPIRAVVMKQQMSHIEDLDQAFEELNNYRFIWSTETNLRQAG